MSIPLVLLTALLGCGEPPPPQPQPKPAAPARKKAPVKAKAKTGNMVPGKGKAPARGKAKAPGRPLPKPVGAPGPVDGVLVLQVTESSDAPAPAPDAPADDAPAPDAPDAPDAPAPETPEAPAADGGKATTKASLTLTWGDGGTADVLLGTVDGVCKEVEAVPVGPEGKQHTPLWTVGCSHDEAAFEMYILQMQAVLAVVRGTPTGNEAKPMDYKPVRRVRLVPGAQLRRKE